jgi:ATP-dependent 26S proteasome regulatory subunit
MALAATNRPDVLDSDGIIHCRSDGALHWRSRWWPLLMAGRFDQEVTVDHPHATGCVRLIRCAIAETKKLIDLSNRSKILTSPFLAHPSRKHQVYARIISIG